MKLEYKRLARDLLDDYPNLKKLINDGDWRTFWKELRKISFSKDTTKEYHDAYVAFILIFGELNIGKAPDLLPIWSFYKQKDLGNLIIPEGIKTLGNDCFREAAFDSIKLPATLKKIEYSAFYKSNLSEIVLPEKLEVIGIDAFRDTNLSKINLPGKLVDIESSCFRGCNISEITVPESVEIIRGNCFYNMCSGKDIIVNLPNKWSRKLPVVKSFLGLDDSKPQKNKNQWVFKDGTTVEGKPLGYSITVNFY